MKKIRQLTTELTFRCNAKCPACHRIRINKINLNDFKYTYTLESFKKLFYPKLLNNLQTLVLNGNFGDSIMNKEFREIISYVKEHGTKILIHTNGGIHDHNYWTDVGNILGKGDIINFDLDLRGFSLIERGLFFLSKIITPKFFVFLVFVLYVPFVSIVNHFGCPPFVD